VSLELGSQVEDVVVDAQLLGHLSGVLDVADRAASRVALPAPEPQGHPGDVVVLLEQQGRGGGRVDPS